MRGYRLVAGHTVAGALARSGRENVPSPVGSGDVPEVLIIGAGIAGLAAARELRGRGRSVRVLEKSRGVGGRAATRRLHGVHVDHGAQFFTVRDERLQALVDGWLESGHVVAWMHGVPTWTADRGVQPPGPNAHPRFACPGGMSTLGKLLAEGTDVEHGARAVAVRRQGTGWRVELEDGSARDAPQVLLTPPLPQTRALLADLPLSNGIQRELDAVRYAPCFAVMAGYSERDAPDWPAVRPSDHDKIAWIARDDTKRDDRSTCVLVIHSTGAHARSRFDDPPDAVADELLADASEIVSWAGRPAWRDVQRWRYALTEQVHPDPWLQVEDGLALAGDAFGEGKIEGAFLSGLEAGRHL